MATNENLPPNVIKQLLRELRNLDESPPEGIKVVVINDDFSMIFADIEGPVGTPYENGSFRMKLLLSRDFPQSPPKGFFLTKIFHPNISSSGEICVNTLKKDWNPSLGLRHVLLAGKMLLEDYEEYARHARLYTGIHATRPKPKLKTGAISESTTALNVEQKPTVGAAPPPVPCAPAAASASKAPSAAAGDHGAVVDPVAPAPGPSAGDGPRR